MNYILIAFPNNQNTKEEIRGEIIMEQETMNGFLEEIFKRGFDKHFYQVQDTVKKESFNIGESLITKAEHHFNKEMAKKYFQLKQALDLK